MINKEGRGTIIFISLFVLAVVLFANLLLHIIFTAVLIVLGLGLIGFTMWFFRRPKRGVRLDDDLIFSPADGKVVDIKQNEEHEYIKEPCWQISIFMSPLDVHQNVVPIDGEVVYSQYHPGKFLVAFNPKSSLLNERHSVAIKHKHKGTLVCKQIAGAVARRIVNYMRVGDQVVQHQPLGFIKFGSRMDVFLPLEAKVLVHLDQKATAGVTVLASW